MDASSDSLFRATKRRKVFRKRAESDGPSDVDSPSGVGAPHANAAQDAAAAAAAEDGLSMAEIMRRRKAGRARKAGIEFGSHQEPKREGELEPFQMAAVDSKSTSLTEMAESRFARQTGQQVSDDADRHMMAYIDSKMAELRESATSSSSSSNAASTSHDRPDSSTTAGQARERKPTSLGKLQEIDLGPDATLRNIRQTQAATQRLQTGDAGPAAEAAAARRKVRLGRDGKPLRPRRRDRRNSEDVQRDKMVEAILKENRLEVYDEPAAGQPDAGDEAADDRLAEEFRREFLDAVQSRTARKAQPGPGAASRGAKGEAASAGPKLGGSRSARARMRAKEEAAKKR